MSFKPKSLKEAGNLNGKKVILRLDFNVPIQKSKVCDDYRIRKAMPTLEYLRDAGATVLIISHLDEKEGNSLSPVADYLNRLFPVKFVKDLDAAAAAMAAAAASGPRVFLCENIRQYKE